MSNQITPGEHIEKSLSDIMGKWEFLVRQKSEQLPADVPSFFIRDRLPIFVKNVARSLKIDSHKKYEKDAQVLAENVCANHGEQRASLPEYSLEQVIYEYYSLKAILNESLLSAQLLTSGVEQEISQAIELAIRHASIAFSNRRATSSRPLNFTEATISPEWRKRADMLSIISAILVTLLGLSGLIEWSIKRILITQLTGNAVMSPSTCAGFLLAGLSSLSVIGHARMRLRELSAKISISVFAGLILLSVAAIASESSFHLDTLFGRDRVGMGPTTALGMIAALFSMILLRVKRSGVASVAQLSAIVVFLIGWTVLVAYLLHFLGPDSGLLGTMMAPATGLGFLLLGLSLFLAKASTSLAALLLSPHPGGSVVRQVLPVAFVFPFATVLAWSSLKSIQALDSDMALAELILFLVVCMLGFAWSLGRQLDRTALDRERNLRMVGSAVRAQHEAEQMTVMLSAESASRDDFVAALSHDMRTPLTAAKLNLQMAMREKNLSASASKSLGRISGSLDRVESMIRGLLDAKAIKAGEHLPVHPVDLLLDQELKALIEELNISYNNQITLVAVQPVRGRWDPEIIRRITDNLVTNAVKYGELGAPITVQLSELTNEIKISVHNWGEGISKADQTKVFHPHYRTDSARTGAQSGWGLGLPLSRSLARAHGGEIDVKSEKVSGTTFTLTLPSTFRMPGAPE